MGWLKWGTDSHHGKTRIKKVGGGSTKREGFVGKKGGPFSTHWSVTTKPSGRKSAHIGRHTDKKK